MSIKAKQSDLVGIPFGRAAMICALMLMVAASLASSSAKAMEKESALSAYGSYSALRESDQTFQVEVDGFGESPHSYSVQPFVVPGGGGGGNGGVGSVSYARLKLSVAKNSRKFKTFRLRYSRNIRGRTAKVVIRSTQKRCDVTGYCFDGRTRIIRRSHVKLKGVRHIRVKKPTRNLTMLTVTISIKGRRTPDGYVHGGRAERTLLGPGLHFN